MVRRVFTSMPPDCAKFYNHLMNRLVLNIWAVRMGLFDSLLCESSDPFVFVRWCEALPRIIETIEANKGSRPD